MSKAENRHYTTKWKKRRKDHFGDLCDNAKCPICATHKSMGNSEKGMKNKYKKSKQGKQNG